MFVAVLIHCIELSHVELSCIARVIVIVVAIVLAIVRLVIVSGRATESQILIVISADLIAEQSKRISDLSGDLIAEGICSMS